MGVALRACLVAVLAAAVLALAGCARTGPRLTLQDWALVCDGCESATLHTPGNVARWLPPGATSYTLRTEARLPPELRGRELTLTLPAIYTLGTLQVEGQTLERLDESPFDRVRPADLQLSFRIPAALTDRETLPLTLVLQRHDAFTSCQIGEEPILAAGPFGDAPSQLARWVNRATGLGVLTVDFFLSLVFLTLFALDRRRVADGWFAAIAGGSTLWQASALGMTQLAITSDVARLPVLATGVICVALPCFCRAYFDAGRAPRWLLACISVLAVSSTALAWGQRYHAGSRLLQLEILVVVAYVIWFLGRHARRGARRGDAALLIGVWVVAGAAGVVNPVADVNVTSLAGLGFVLAHGALLVRTHTRSLRGLNAALAERVALLEQRNREVATLNDELRRQIGDRSARLVETLARIGSVRARAVSLAVGAAIGDRYRVIRRLGEGAMGTVYEVERASDGSRFALKTVTDARGGAALARLAREAEIATKVVHPNVVGIVDVDVAPEGMLYIVMELVDGHPLSADAQRFGDVAWARPVLGQIAAGLRALHDAGIVHRDLKPSNVLLEQRDGNAPHAKIADFGIARVASTTTVDAAARAGGPVDVEAATEQSSPVSPLAVSDPGLTATGVVVGTPLYMAPELASGSKDALPASDIWSFGVMAYELATGRLPFEVPPVHQVMATGRWHGRLPDVRDVPAPLDAVIASCLGADPARRMSAEELTRLLA